MFNALDRRDGKAVGWSSGGDRRGEDVDRFKNLVILWRSVNDFSLLLMQEKRRTRKALEAKKVLEAKLEASDQRWGYSRWFEPEGNIELSGLMVRVSVVLRRTVVGGWRFDALNCDSAQCLTYSANRRRQLPDKGLIYHIYAAKEPKNNDLTLPTDRNWPIRTDYHSQ